LAGSPPGRCAKAEGTGEGICTRLLFKTRGGELQKRDLHLGEVGAPTAARVRGVGVGGGDGGRGGGEEGGVRGEGLRGEGRGGATRMRPAGEKNKTPDALTD